MSEIIAILQNYNQEIVKYIESIRFKREELESEIKEAMEEKAKIEEEINGLKSRLKKANEVITIKTNAKNSCDQVLYEAEAGLKKITESSQVLLSVVQREADALDNLTK